MYVNLSAYRFVTLRDLPALQKRLRAHCRAKDILGTIYLSEEGININVVGTQEATDAFQAYMARDPRFRDLPFKASVSDFKPFSKLVIKLRPEIITFKRDDIKPEDETVPTISAKELKALYDNKEDFVIIDTRNDFEYDYGTFDNAINPNIERFTDFPAAVARMPEQYKEKKVVIYCTGGVRCEKAGPAMTQQGYKDVYQLDGGILKYFEECGGEHYHGSCFVFDDRVALNSDLQKA